MNGDKRKNWTTSLTIVASIAAVIALIGCLAKPPARKTDRNYLKSSAGNVLFDHGQHQKNADSCAACHHPLYGSTLAISCSDCHDDELDPTDFEHEELISYHSRDCSTCHEQTMDDDEATSCRDCHQQQAEEAEVSVSCMECHEDYEPDMMEHDEYLEVEDHTCLGCHTPSTISQAYHNSCTPCHLENAPARFAAKDGKTVCGACHLR